MSFSYRMAIATIAAMPLLGMAQNKSAQPASVNTIEDASRPVYHSAFSGYRPMQEISDRPDAHWRTVNDEVARLGGHGGHTPDAGARKDAPAGRPAPAEHQMQHKH